MAIHDVDDLRGMLDYEVMAEITRLRTALEAVHRYGLNVAGYSEAYGETESAHLWNEIAAIAEEALWPTAPHPGAMSE